MSTTIHTGYRLPAARVPHLTVALPEVVAPVMHRLAVEAIATVAVLIESAAAHADRAEAVAKVRAAVSADQASSPRSPRQRSLYSDASDAVVDTWRALAVPHARQVPERFDLGCDIVFLFDPGEQYEWAYVTVYAEHQAYVDVWERLAGVEPWPYWDNSDPPDDVSDGEWEQRGQVWSRVLGGDAPADRGLTWGLGARNLEIASIWPSDDSMFHPSNVANVAANVERELKSAESPRPLRSAADWVDLLTALPET